LYAGAFSRLERLEAKRRAVQLEEERAQARAQRELLSKTKKFNSHLRRRDDAASEEPFTRLYGGAKEQRQKIVDAKVAQEMGEAAVLAEAARQMRIRTSAFGESPPVASPNDANLRLYWDATERNERMSAKRVQNERNETFELESRSIHVIRPSHLALADPTVGLSPEKVLEKEDRESEEVHDRLFRDRERLEVRKAAGKTFIEDTQDKELRKAASQLRLKRTSPWYKQPRSNRIEAVVRGRSGTRESKAQVAQPRRGASAQRAGGKARGKGNHLQDAIVPFFSTSLGETFPNEFLLFL
jgi:hypothetical protein